MRGVHPHGDPGIPAGRLKVYPDDAVRISDQVGEGGIQLGVADGPQIEEVIGRRFNGKDATRWNQAIIRFEPTLVG